MQGITVCELRDSEDVSDDVIEHLSERIIGRFALEDIVHPHSGEILVRADELINEDTAQNIIDAGIKEVKIRSVLTCKSRFGVCVKCYGRNLATEILWSRRSGRIIAAQSIGEPGTQLTMRTFHTGEL